MKKQTKLTDKERVEALLEAMPDPDILDEAQELIDRWWGGVTEIGGRLNKASKRIRKAKKVVDESA